MEKEWLEEKLSAEKIENKEPFGYIQPRWQTLKDMAQPGDEFWSFSSDPLSWSCLCGRAGYSLVRDGEIIGSIITVMN